MAKTATETKTKSATRTANTKTKAAAGDKPKRAPSAYNNYVSSHMKPWLAENPGKTNKDAMKAIGAMWQSAAENPNAGKAKATKPAAKKPASSKSKKSKKEETVDADAENEGPEVEPNSDE